MPHLDFWYEFAPTYSCPAEAMRLHLFGAPSFVTRSGELF